MTPWSNEEITEWAQKIGWRFGANFTPSTAINQLEFWQAETFDPETIDRELNWASDIGMNIMRVFLHDLVWQTDREGFIQRINQYLDMAARKGIGTMFVFFDDCWNRDPKPGTQPAPKPMTHNSGWMQSPGITVAEDPSQWARLEDYVTGLVSHFREDDRILLWDVYNEPGNSMCGGVQVKDHALRGDRALPLLQKAFEWTRAGSPSQPLTAGTWNYGENFQGLVDFSRNNSDIISFHNYSPPEKLREHIHQEQAFGRPVICSEYMGRIAGSTFADCLPVLKECGVWAINWGLVSGKSQTIYPWGWSPEKGTPEKWFHDVFNADGTLLYPEEKAAFDAIRA